MSLSCSETERKRLLRRLLYVRKENFFFLAAPKWEIPSILFDSWSERNIHFILPAHGFRHTDKVLCGFELYSRWVPLGHYLFWYEIRPVKKIIYITKHSLPARGRPLFLLLHAEKVRFFSACNKGNRRRLHARKTSVPVDWIALNCNIKIKILS